MRDNKAYRSYLQVSTLCKSLGQNDVKMLTITDGIKDSLTFYESLQMFIKKEVRDRYMIKNDIDKLMDKERKKQIGSRLGRRWKRKDAAKKKDANLSDYSSYNDFGIEMKFSNHLLMNSNKRCKIITSRVHPG